VVGSGMKEHPSVSRLERGRGQVRGSGCCVIIVVVVVPSK
jgi:hypothetical protein